MVCIAVIAQNQYDAIWLLGSPRLLPTDLQFGGSMLDFSSGEPEATFFNIGINLDPTALICNENGELIFYTNGCKVMNAQHEIMENGDTINAGARHHQYCNFSYPSIQGVMGLPKPDAPDQYGLFHSVVDDDIFLITELRYTEINAAQNDGLGEVIFKDQTILQDTISSLVSAVRHANGRDWWIVGGKHNSNAFYTIYYGPNGPEYSGNIQLIDSVETSTDIRQTTFSPDGSIYAVANRFHGVRLYHFDRCAGMLSNLAKFDLEADTLSVTGVAISPNNRFLYIGAIDYLYQFDLEDDNIAESGQIVAQYDGYIVDNSPSLRTTFGHLMHAPDGKIYGTAPNSSNVLHIIHNPNEIGLDCNVEQHGFELPTMHGFRPPNLPHFRLWDIPGSPCDTLGIDMPTSTDEVVDNTPSFQVFPNPAHTNITIKFEQQLSGELRLFNIAGQLVLSTRVDRSNQAQLNVQRFADGLYLASFYDDDGLVSWQKFLIQ